ncbi:glucose-6-phosphate isomerase [Actinopolymorpha sp. B17G11]|uniref:glucose-6-phosphate isomerase n=1 Tax=Actinopolymorpha sp. B17G11 TaxID=3160861 RepID=UPI0032E478AB
MTDAVRVEVDQPTCGAVLRALVDDDVAPALARGDSLLWGTAAQEEASIRLGWVDSPRTSRPLLAEIDALSAELRQEGLDHIALAGMGGSSLAPEVITATAGVALTVLDSTDPAVVRRALADRLDRTVLVVSSKSGSTVETDSQRRAYLRAFADAGIDGPSRIVVVTDPGSPLAELAESEGYRKVFLADPKVGGRYSALTAFGLVPAGLAGADVAELLDEAEAILPALAESTPDNPALTLAAALAAAHEQGLEKVVLGDGATPIRGFPAWVEQLVAESTGKDGRGLLPVDVGRTSATTPGWNGAGAGTRVSIGTPEHQVPGQVLTSGPLGAMFQLWEAAVAIAGRVIGINPFDQPNVEEAKKQARALLDAPEAGDGMPLALTEGAVEVYGDPSTLRGEQSLAALLASLHVLVPETGYLALQAYLDRDGEADAAELRPLVAATSGVQTTFGWGPRFLHSTGQYHKGGHRNGGFVQITGEVAEDLAVPDRPYTFGQLQRAQAAGDARVLIATRQPVVRLHLTDRRAGLAQLIAAVKTVRP